MIGIRLLLLHSLALLETVYITKIYIKMPHWSISITLNDLYNVEWYVLCWMIFTILNDLYNAFEWFVLSWMIWTTSNNLTLLNDLQYIERLALGWMVCTRFNNLYRDRGFVALYYWGSLLLPFFEDWKWIPWFRLSMGLISHFKCWFKNIRNPRHNILAIYYVLGQVQNLISSITDFLQGLPHELSNDLRLGGSGN